MPANATRLGRARHRARRPQRPPEAARALVSGRRLDVGAGDDRRHGGEQQLRRALDALRQHGAQRARGRNLAHERRDVDVRRRRRASARRGPAALPRARRRRFARCYARERDEIAARVPKLQRRVAGYNLDMASTGAFNLAQLLVGSEGTLGYFRRIKLKLAPLPAHKALGVVHFPTFYQAMDLTRHIVALEPDGRRARRSHDDRAVARHRGVPRDDRQDDPRRARGDPARRVRRRRARAAAREARGA